MCRRAAVTVTGTVASQGRESGTGGTVTVSDVSPLGWTPLPSAPPNETVVAVARPVPVIVTLLPGVALPGKIDLIAGGALV